MPGYTSKYTTGEIPKRWQGTLDNIIALIWQIREIFHVKPYEGSMYQSLKHVERMSKNDIFHEMQVFTSYKRMAGGEFIGFNNATYLSAMSSSYRNHALAHYMRENKVCYTPI